MKYLKRLFLPLCIALVVLTGGCTTVGIVRSLPFVYNHIDDEINDCSFSGSSWKEEFGGKWTRELIPLAVDIVEASVNREDGLWVFEIETRGNAEEVMKRYGAAIQFGVVIQTVNHKLSKSMYTTDKIGYGVLITRERPEIHVSTDKNEVIRDARLVSKQKLLDSIKVLTDGKRLRFYLPGKWIDDSLEWIWLVYSYFVPPPVKPIPTDIAHLFYLPSVDCARPGSLGSVWGAGILWRVKSDSKGPK